MMKKLNKLFIGLIASSMLLTACSGAGNNDKIGSLSAKFFAQIFCQDLSNSIDIKFFTLYNIINVFS